MIASCRGVLPSPSGRFRHAAAPCQRDAYWCGAMAAHIVVAGTGSRGSVRQHTPMAGGAGVQGSRPNETLARASSISKCAMSAWSKEQAHHRGVRLRSPGWSMFAPALRRSRTRHSSPALHASQRRLRPATSARFGSLRFASQIRARDVYKGQREMVRGGTGRGVGRGEAQAVVGRGGSGVGQDEAERCGVGFGLGRGGVG